VEVCCDELRGTIDRELFCCCVLSS
jgi:hypothetical protein